MTTITCDCCGRVLAGRFSGSTLILTGMGMEQHFCDVLCLKALHFEHTPQDAEKIKERKAAAA